MPFSFFSCQATFHFVPGLFISVSFVAKKNVKNLFRTGLFGDLDRDVQSTLATTKPSRLDSKELTAYSERVVQNTPQPIRPSRLNDEELTAHYERVVQNTPEQGLPDDIQLTEGCDRGAQGTLDTTTSNNIDEAQLI